MQRFFVFHGHGMVCRLWEKYGRAGTIMTIGGLLQLLLVSSAGANPSSSFPDTNGPPPPDASLSHPEAGQLVQRYVGPEQYDAHKQNWDATQDTSGTFYVTNTGGVLVYDGRTWQTIPTANHSIARSVAADDQGRVFVDAQRDFGVLRRDSVGEIQGPGAATGDRRPTPEEDLRGTQSSQESSPGGERVALGHANGPALGAMGRAKRPGARGRQRDVLLPP